MIQCEGQLELTDFLTSKVKRKTVKGKAQYTQIGEVVKKAFDDYKDDPNFVDRLTNVISIYVLEQSSGYMDYLREESK